MYVIQLFHRLISITTIINTHPYFLFRRCTNTHMFVIVKDTTSASSPSAINSSSPPSPIPHESSTSAPAPESGPQTLQTASPRPKSLEPISHPCNRECNPTTATLKSTTAWPSGSIPNPISTLFIFEACLGVSRTGRLCISSVIRTCNPEVGLNRWNGVFRIGRRMGV